MRLRLIVWFALVVAAMSWSASSSTASPFSDAAERLDGEWRGPDFVLRVDSTRAQASTALDRPFEWQRFLIKEVRQNEIIFTIGPELFEAKLEAEILVLSGTTFRGERVLFRDTGLRGTTEE